MTPEDVKKRTDALYNQWLDNFEPLYLAAIELRRLMYNRIFETSGGNLNTAGEKIPLPARRGGNYSTPYSPAYTKIKQRRPIPLELTGFLRRNFSTEPILEQGLAAALMLNDLEYAKAQGLQFGREVNPRYTFFRGYGIIFEPTEEEEKEFLRIHTQLITEQINKQLGA
jgi:hypothetical protein